MSPNPSPSTPPIWRLQADSHLTRPLDPAVDAAMAGGTLSPEAGRLALAALVNAAPAALSLAGGLRGSLHLAVTTLATGYPGRKHLVVTAVESPVWVQVLESLRRQGFRVTTVGLDSHGHLDLAALKAAITAETLMVSAGWVSQDTGAILPIEAMAELAHEQGAFAHSQANNAVGYLPIDLATSPLDLLSFSGQTLAGPERTGVLYVASRTGLDSVARQEARVFESNRAADLMGLGAAATVAAGRFPDALAGVARQRDRLDQTILRLVPGSRRLGPAGGARPPHMLAWAFEGIHHQALIDLLALDGFCLRSAAGCESPQPLAAGLEALNLPPAYRFGAVTLGLPFDADDAVLAELATRLPAAVETLRRRSPVARHLLG